MNKTSYAQPMLSYGSSVPAPLPIDQFNQGWGLPQSIAGGPQLSSPNIPNNRMSGAPQLSTNGASSGIWGDYDMSRIDTHNAGVMGGMGADMSGISGGAGGGFWGKDGFTLDSVGTIASTIADFGQLWAGIQQNKLAKDSLNFQKEAYHTNLKNQRSSYNLALEDRISSRYAQKNMSSEDADAKIAQHKI